MSEPPRMTDRVALRRNRARALRSGPALFLHDRAADEIEERLDEINRTFTSPAIVTGFPVFWADRYPTARIVADEAALDLKPASHDLILHMLTLHWADDPVGQLVQCRRALRPDGLLLAVTFGGQSLYELRASLAEAEALVTGGLSPRVLPMAEIRDLGALLQRAGFALPVADSLTLPASYANAWHLMRDLRAMGETNALNARSRHITPRRLMEVCDQTYASSFPDTAGRVRATFELVVLTGWAPDESQQKPLRPGSAQTRLADALGTQETPAGDPIQSGRN